jgi:hypothetical protein
MEEVEYDLCTDDLDTESGKKLDRGLGGEGGADLEIIAA